MNVRKSANVGNVRVKNAHWAATQTQSTNSTAT